MRLPKIEGFTPNAANAFWLVCDQCGDMELFFGTSAELDALNWSQTHFRAEHWVAI